MSDANVIPQSPVPPFYRPPQGNTMQTLTGPGAIQLGEGTTYLNSTSGGPHALTMPNGQYQGQVHRILVRGDAVSATATWNLTGTFITPIVGFDFDSTGHSLTLEWDGHAWHNTGGNATPTF
jgi:hypothetical protein